MSATPSDWSVSSVAGPIDRNSLVVYVGGAPRLCMVEMRCAHTISLPAQGL